MEKDPDRETPLEQRLRREAGGAQGHKPGEENHPASLMGGSASRAPRAPSLVRGHARPAETTPAPGFMLP